jgi:predicted Zn-dependent protease
LRALSQLPESDVVPELRETLLTQLASHLLAARDFRGIKELLNSSVSKTGNLTASLHFAHGLALMEERQYARGIEEFRACIQKRDLPTLTPVHRDCRGAAPRHCWALCLRGLNQVEEAARVFDEALQEEPQSRPLRHDYARFLADAGQPVPALNLLHQLVAEKPDDLEAWRKGGEIALSDADFLEFALDWTSEALKALPRDSVLLGQRAEALLLNEDLDAARACLESWGDECSAKFQAARILCELAQDHEIASIPHEAEAAVSRGFMQWYRQLLKWERSRTVLAINERMNPLRAVLPTAADMLGAVLVAVG